jgi:hypothetical protein
MAVALICLMSGARGLPRAQSHTIPWPDSLRFGNPGPSTLTLELTPGQSLTVTATPVSNCPGAKYQSYNVVGADGSWGRIFVAQGFVSGFLQQRDKVWLINSQSDDTANLLVEVAGASGPSLQPRQCLLEKALIAPESLDVPILRGQTNHAEWREQPRVFTLALSMTTDVRDLAPSRIERLLLATADQASAIFERQVGIAFCASVNTAGVKVSDSKRPDLTVAQKEVNQGHSEQFDIGVLFWRNTTSSAAIGHVCDGKASAKTLVNFDNEPGRDPWTLAHEVAHQFGATHTFDDKVAGDPVPETAMEPGRGVSEMGYPQDPNQRWFHAATVAQLLEGRRRTLKLADCGTTRPMTMPSGAAQVLPHSYKVPPQTPFTLSAEPTPPTSSSDWLFAIDDATTDVNNGPPPFFTSQEPTEHPRRTFPPMAELVTGRTARFLAAARDPYGRVAMAAHTVTVTGTRPFEIKTPQAAWRSGVDNALSWNPGETAGLQASIPVAFVEVFVFNGKAWRRVKVVKNNGSADIRLQPCEYGPGFRIRLKPRDQPFFAISKPFDVVGPAAGASCAS